MKEVFIALSLIPVCMLAGFMLHCILTIILCVADAITGKSLMYHFRYQGSKYTNQVRRNQ